MQTVYIGFGREINARHWDGARVASKPRGVWWLHEEDWKRFIGKMRNRAEQYGRIMFGGQGHGINTVTGEHDEPGYCIALEVTDGRWTAIEELRADLARVAAQFGQLEFAFCVGHAQMVKVEE